MKFIEPTKEAIATPLDHLTPESEPEWGLMTAQHMVEHLTQSLMNALGEVHFEQVTPEEKLPKLQQFLFSDQPMPKGHKVPYLPENNLLSLHHPDLETAKKALLEKWEEFERTFSENPDKKTLHPVFGMLDREGWYQVHRKHFTHHYEQFGLVGKGD